MAADRQIKIAVLGSGPSGLFAASALIKQQELRVAVDVFDRLPTPFGLVRYGVAPDHPNIKSVVGVLQQVLDSERVRFFGCVEFGTGITRQDLLRHYDAVIYAMGASADRQLGIPGESLPGSYSATEFVAWYSGHPDAAQPFSLDTVDSVAVIGVGNVALDVARMLAKTSADLAQTDAPTAVVKALDTSSVQEIHVIGRRGPQHAKFTTKELRELGDLANATVHVLGEEVVVDPDVELGKTVKANVAVLQSWVGARREAKPRRISMRFWLRPVEITGRGRVEALRCERTTLDATGSVVGTGRFETIPVDVVLRAAGYRSVPLPDVPFDADRGVIANAAGRVLDADSHLRPGEYVTGWLKRGPTGVIGTNKSDAAETVRALVEDLLKTGAAARPELPDLAAELAARGVRPVDLSGWLRIDAEELRRGADEHRERSKIPDWQTLRDVGGAGPA